MIHFLHLSRELWFVNSQLHALYFLYNFVLENIFSWCLTISIFLWKIYMHDFHSDRNCVCGFERKNKLLWYCELLCCSSDHDMAYVPIPLTMEKIRRSSSLWISRGENKFILPHGLESYEILNWECSKVKDDGNDF